MIEARKCRCGAASRQEYNGRCEDCFACDQVDPAHHDRAAMADGMRNWMQEQRRPAAHRIAMKKTRS